MHEVPGLEAQRGVGRRMPDPTTSRTVIRVRMVATVVIGVLIALIPLFGPWRLWIGIGVTLSAMLTNAYALDVLGRGGRPTRVLAVGDVAMALAVVALAPDSMTIAAIVYVSVTALNVFWFGPRTSAALACGFGVGILLVGLWATPPWWVATVICFSICSATSIVVLHTLALGAAQTRRRYDSLVNGLDAVVWEQDEYGAKTFVSGNVADVVGTTAAEFSRSGFHLSRVHPDDRDVVLDARSRMADGQPSETHTRMLDDCGNYRHLHERVSVSLNLDGTLHGTRGFVVDESARWEAEADLRRHAEFIEGIPVALTVLRLIDRDDPSSLQIVSMNPAAEAMFGPSPAGVPAQSHIAMNDKWCNRLGAVARGSEPYERPFVDVPGVDGVFALRAVPLPDDHVGVSLEDVTKRARLAESLKHQARHDALTGLPNRAQFNERLNEVVGRPDARPTALLLVDLDEFKEINDALGHEYGDRVLTEFARRLGRRLRNCDLVARLGGDEFAVLVSDSLGESHALEIAGRIMDLCESHFEVGDFRFKVGASVGVAVHPEHGTDAETLLRHADAAMYQAKANGGGVTLYCRGHELSTVRRLELMGELGEAIRTDQMEVHYQPRIDLRTHRTVGLEALVRWRHPRHGLLPPDEFIELAEVSGNIRDLTECVGERATAEIDEVLGSHDLILSVNLSSRTLYDSRLAEWVEELLASGRIAPDHLCFEITETELMEDPNRSLPLLHEIRRHGVKFSVDDFGTGYSSLAYLRELPIDEIKIDRSFVADLRSDDTIVRAVIDLGHNLGLHVVAEGVEDGLTEHMLRTMGCDSAQGFRWGAAMPAETLARHLSGAWENPITVR